MLDLEKTISESPAESVGDAWAEASKLLQGNIVKPHGRDNVTIIFFRIDETAEATRGLGNLGTKFVTSADQQAEQSRLRKENANTVLGNLYLSAWGYRKLGYSENSLRIAFKDEWFLAGMVAKADRLHDDPASWEHPFKERPPDGMLLLACDDAVTLNKAAQKAQKAIGTVGWILATQPGEVKRDTRRRPIENFGFRDGIAMPTIVAKSRSGQQQVPANMLLVRDVLAEDDQALGSFVVYRKYRQDVKGFKSAVKKLAGALGVSQPEAGAMIVGRFQNGTPLSNPGGKPGDVPKFQADPDGAQCPFHAHIRKVNPRFRQSGLALLNPLFRRSVSYKGDKEDVGLLFMAMQASIQSSFGFIMSAWVDNPDFPRPQTGADALIGSSQPGQLWKHSDGKPLPVDIGRHISLLGGEFFFAPSLAFFQKLMKR